MATIKEVSRLAQVSPSTVSRVLNGTAPVAEETRERVQAAIESLEYQPNRFARGLVTNRSDAIGVVVNEISSPFYSYIVQGIEEIVEAEGKHLIVSSGHADEDRERRAVEFLGNLRADVLILHLEAISDYELLRWTQQGTPIVVVGRYVAEYADRCIYLDNVAGGYRATRHLLDRGHTRIACITGWMAIKDARDRLEGYRQALFEAGVPYDEMLVVEGDFVEEGGQRAARRLLERDLEFTALVAGNDQTAAGALSVFREHGLRVPEDVSVIGYDDVLLARYLYPALSTIRQPLVEMGRAAAQLALAAIGVGDGRGVTRKFDPKLVVRDSVSELK